MTKTFDKDGEERRLNGIFAQMDSENEGTRSTAAGMIRNWFERHRTQDHGLKLQLTLNGSGAARTLLLIKELEKRIDDKDRENVLLREYVKPADIRKVAKQMDGNFVEHRDAFLDVVLSHLYGGRFTEVPRGTAKRIAGILGCAVGTARAMLEGKQPVPPTYVAKLGEAPPFPIPTAKAPKIRPVSARHGTNKVSKLQSDLALPNSYSEPQSSAPGIAMVGGLCLSSSQ